MSHSDIAIEKVLELEGGLVDNKHDPGGITNYGISLRYLQDLPDMEGDVDGDGDVDADDIKSMGLAEAKKYYRDGWWTKYGYERIESARIAIKVMDMSVNMGGTQAHKLVQRSLRAVDVQLTDDGILGPMSMEAINDIQPRELLPAIRCSQAGFYYSLVMRNAALRKAGVLRSNGLPYHDFSVFLKGWLNRAYS